MQSESLRSMRLLQQKEQTYDGDGYALLAQSEEQVEAAFEALTTAGLCEKVEEVEAALKDGLFMYLIHLHLQ